MTLPVGVMRNRLAAARFVFAFGTAGTSLWVVRSALKNPPSRKRRARDGGLHPTLSHGKRVFVMVWGDGCRVSETAEYPIPITLLGGLRRP